MRKPLALCGALLALVAPAAWATTTTVCLVNSPGSARNWQVPADWSNTGAQAWIVAAGGDGGAGTTGQGGGGGGAGQLADNNGATPSFTAGQFVSVQIGAHGGGFAKNGAGASWICGTSAPSSPPTCDSASNDGAWVGVSGPGNGTTSPSGSNNGSSGGIYAVGSIPHVSGKGGSGDTYGGGAGGGAQSLTANGGVGGNSSATGGGAGGSAGGSSPSSGGAAATSTTPAGDGGTSSPVALATCTAGDLPNGTVVYLGSGGGGGSPNYPNGGNATTYGGAGGGAYGVGTPGVGYQGILVIQYTPGAPPPPGSGANQQLMLMGVGLVANDNAPPAANDDAPIITRRAAP